MNTTTARNLPYLRHAIFEATQIDMYNAYEFRNNDNARLWMNAEYLDDMYLCGTIDSYPILS